MDIKIINLSPSSLKQKTSSKSKATGFGTLTYSECSHTLFARDSTSSNSILLKTLSKESNHASSFHDSPISFFLKSAETLLDNHFSEIEIIGTSVLRSLSQIGSACVNHKNGIFIFNSPWSQEILKLEVVSGVNNEQQFSINDLISYERKLLELANLAILEPNVTPNCIGLSLMPGQCLLLNSEKNFTKRINFCSDYLCKYSSNLQSNNISLFGSSGSVLKSSNFFLNSRNLAAERCHNYFYEVLSNLIRIEDQLSKIFNGYTVLDLFKRLTPADTYKIKNHSKAIFNNKGLPMLDMCISASTAHDATLSTMLNCNSFASDIFYRKFLSSWIINWSPYI